MLFGQLKERSAVVSQSNVDDQNLQVGQVCCAAAFMFTLCKLS